MNGNGGARTRASARGTTPGEVSNVAELGSPSPVSTGQILVGHPGTVPSSNKKSLPDLAQLTVERIIGFNPSSGALSHHPGGLIVYPAGNFVVLYDASNRSQLCFYQSKKGTRAFVCSAVSRCGSFVAGGERGTGAEVSVWELASGKVLATLKGHTKYGIGSVSFSPDGKLLASTGLSHDGQLCLWDWQHGTLLAKQHTQAKFTPRLHEDSAPCHNSASIATVGKELFKLWGISLTMAPTTATFYRQLTIRPATCSKDLAVANFVGSGHPSAAPHPGSEPRVWLYRLPSSGVLLLMKESADKWFSSL
eukprot:gene28655-31826_t